MKVCHQRMSERAARLSQEETITGAVVGGFDKVNQPAKESASWGNNNTSIMQQPH